MNKTIKALERTENFLKLWLVMLEKNFINLSNDELKELNSDNFRYHMETKAKINELKEEIKAIQKAKGVL